ncbi:MAG: PTS sugar transporter subunit IIA [Candidatus Hydrogenedentes bacterium]|jgi:PTS system fructose-specific IIC component|nr:PTS sugar transporter subunit IIA [Candidatus Hydrogenedentota bacterium]
MAKEAGLDRRHLVEFLQEEFILTDLVAEDKWEALAKLTDFYARTHRLKSSARDALYATIEQRERDMSTAIGQGAAIPHGRVESGSAIQGALGICPEGVDFDRFDGRPVKLIALIVTPSEHEAFHLEVLASLSSMISSAKVRTRLIAATDPNDAWEIIEDEEVRGCNYFLETEDDRNGA